MESEGKAIDGEGRRVVLTAPVRIITLESDMVGDIYVRR